MADRPPGRPGRYFGGVVPSAALAGVVVAVLVALFAVRFDWHAVLVELAAADGSMLLVGFAGSLAALGCWSEVHRRLLESAGAEVGVRLAVVVYAAGTFARLVLPVGNAGAVAVLSYAFDRRTDLEAERTVAAVTLGELASIAASLGLAAVGIAVFAVGAPTEPVARRLVAGVGIGLVGVGAVCVAAWVNRRRLAGLARDGAAAAGAAIERACRRAGYGLPTGLVERRLRGFGRALSAASTDRRTLAIAFGLALAGWAGLAAGLWACALALGVDVPLAVALFVVPVAGFATVLPVPGGLGGYEAALAGGLYALAGLDPASAVAVSLLFRLPSYWFPMLLGGVAATALSLGRTELADATVGPVAIVDD